MDESRVYLEKTATGELVEASLLNEVSDMHLKLWAGAWRSAMKTHCAERSLKDKPEDHHWDWKWKARQWRPMLGYHSFAITCEGDLQGLMLASDLKSARIQEQFGKPLVYVEFLATAPWNRPEFQRPPRYRGIGTIMVAAAIELSWDLGYKGRIGLHALPKAEPFYKTVCKMTELGKDAADQGLMYYEMTEKQAKQARLNH